MPPRPRPSFPFFLARAALALRHFCVARDLGRCDHDYPDGTGTIARTISWNYSSARHTGFSQRVGGPTTPTVRGSGLYCKTREAEGVMTLRSEARAGVRARCGSSLASYG